jgi:hypothetical protein
VAFEILHSMGRKKSEKKGLMALKLDMSKAYDRVEWPFLAAILKKMAFPGKWIKLIMDCVQPLFSLSSSMGNLFALLLLQEGYGRDALFPHISSCFVPKPCLV